MGLNRRQLLHWASLAPVAAATTLAVPSVFASPMNSTSRSSGLILPADHETNLESHRTLKLRNLHTNEHVNVTYWEQGEYHVDALAEIYLLMRDHRANSITAIDVNLLDQLHSVQSKLQSNKEILLVSGYRSPQTNSMLRASSKGNGVAKHSLHMQGKAMDFRIAGTNLRQVHRATLASTQGGVGYYSRGGYIHMDTGRKRKWGL